MVTNDDLRDPEDLLRSTQVMYEQYLDLTSTTIAPITNGWARQEFFAPPPSPLTLAFNWSDHVFMERSDQ